MPGAKIKVNKAFERIRAETKKAAGFSNPTAFIKEN
jgi:hypothetical protein